MGNTIIKRLNKLPQLHVNGSCCWVPVKQENKYICKPKQHPPPPPPPPPKKKKKKKQLQRDVRKDPIAFANNKNTRLTFEVTGQTFKRRKFTILLPVYTGLNYSSRSIFFPVILNGTPLEGNQKSNSKATDPLTA